MNRIEALAKYLEITLGDGETLEDYVSESSYNENEFEAEGGTYLVLTDEEADDAAREDIAELLWAFNAEFLSGHTGLPSEVFSALQENQSEDANETIRTLVDKCGNFDQLVDEAVSSDGRAHFLNTYDGHEYAVGDYFIYRTN